MSGTPGGPNQTRLSFIPAAHGYPGDPEPSALRLQRLSAAPIEPLRSRPDRPPLKEALRSGPASLRCPVQEPPSLHNLPWLPRPALHGKERSPEGLAAPFALRSLSLLRFPALRPNPSLRPRRKRLCASDPQNAAGSARSPGGHRRRGRAGGTGGGSTGAIPARGVSQLAASQPAGLGGSRLSTAVIAAVSARHRQGR